MNAEPGRLSQAERDLRQALEVMAHPGSGYQPEEWMLLATLVGEAELVAQAKRVHDPAFQMPLLKQAVEKLRDLTADFTNPSFKRATRAVRRRYPALFVSMR
jgi:hypothetical protein